jgi:hypothetical protein
VVSRNFLIYCSYSSYCDNVRKYSAYLIKWSWVNNILRMTCNSKLTVFLWKILFSMFGTWLTSGNWICSKWSHGHWGEYCVPKLVALNNHFIICQYCIGLELRQCSAGWLFCSTCYQHSRDFGCCGLIPWRGWLEGCVWLKLLTRVPSCGLTSSSE